MTTHAQPLFSPSIDQDMLKPGDPNRLVLFLLHDSRVPTQRESIDLMEMKSIIPRIYADEENFQIVKLDVSKEPLPDNFPVSASKISQKNNPSILIRADDSIHKLPPNALESLQAFNRNLNRIVKVKEVKSVRDLSSALKSNNKKLDDITVVYCKESGEIETKEEEQALRILKHESQF